MTKNLGTIGFRNRSAWQSGTSYRKDDRVQVGRGWAYCVEDHTSGDNFGADMAMGLWDWLVNASGLEDMEQALADTKAATIAATDATTAAENATVATKEVTAEAREAVDVLTKNIAPFNSDEFIYGIADLEGNVLFAIRRDGTCYQPKGIPDEVAKRLDGIHDLQLMENDEYLFAICDSENNVLFGIDRTGASVLNSIKGTVTIEEFESKEFIYAVVDSAGNLLFGVKQDGSFYMSKYSLPQEILDDLKKLNQFMVEDESDMEFLYKILDKEGNVLFGINYNGNIFAPKGMTEAAKKKFGEVEEKMSRLASDVEYVKTHGKDWSAEKFLHLPIPLVPARVEITGTVPTSKYISVAGVLKYSDYLGNSFEKPILWSLQGNISSGFDKKNFGIDILNTAGDEDDTMSIKFGNWPAFDSFHLKAFISDFWKIRSLGVYRHAEAIAQSRPYYKRRPWDLIHGAANKTVEETLLGGVGEVTQDIHNGALGRPDGFPFMLYINGTPWGLYTWNIKKDKDNYCIAKNDNNAKQMFFGDYMTGVFEHYNNSYWSISDYDLLKLEGNGAARAIVIPGYTSSSSQRLVMESAGVEGMTLSITNSSKEYLYSVYYNGNPVTADNTWEAGDCVSVKRTGTSPDYYFNVTPIGKKWNKEKGYSVNEYAYDEDEMDFAANGNTSHLVVRRLFKLAISNNSTFAGYEYDEEGYPVQLSYYTDENGEQAVKRSGRILTHRTMRPSYVNWRTLEVRNPKKTICVANDGLNEDGTPKYKLEYYDYDSPSDYAQTGVYERTHEIISGDEFTQSQVTALIGTGETENFSKKEYTRSVNARKTIEEYSFVCPILDKALSAQNLADWGFETEAEAKKAIFAEHNDVDHNLDFFIVYNDTNYYDSITHNTLYTMYDGKKLFANVYDTDIALGMSSTYTNSFPAVSSSILAAGRTFAGYLWTYYAAEIKARWAELRDAGVISASAFEKMVWDIVSSIGVENYEEELRLWEQPAYRAPVYWRMAAGSLMILEDGDGLPYHGYDESVNKEVEGKDTWVEGVAVALNDVVNYNGHSYICTVAHTTSSDKRPDKSYTCGYPSSGGVYDSPRRIIEWFKKRIEYLDAKFEYVAKASADEVNAISAGQINDIIENA